jgi:hypothetical protein
MPYPRTPHVACRQWQAGGVMERRLVADRIALGASARYLRRHGRPNIWMPRLAAVAGSGARWNSAVGEITTIAVMRRAHLQSGMA